MVLRVTDLCHLAFSSLVTTVTYLYQYYFLFFGYFWKTADSIIISIENFMVFAFTPKWWILWTNSVWYQALNSFTENVSLQYSPDTFQHTTYFFCDKRFLFFAISFYSHFDREKLALFIARHSDFSLVLSHSNRIKQFVMLIFINNAVSCFMLGVPYDPELCRKFKDGFAPSKCLR